MAENVGGIYFDVTLDTRKMIQGERDAKRRLDGVGADFERLEARATKVASAISAALAAIAIGGLTSKLIETQRQFDVLFSSLKTVTGGSQAANVQFQKLREFASSTPYSLDQTVQGFIKLKALGLDPSERAMRSFGNTAAAMGKSLNQMIEAVADASTSEFERLKEFGIKAKVQGDQVSLTFQGVTTTVRNSSRDIVEYLTKIGEVNFAGAMSERMKTLDGDISNLQDSLQALYLSVSQSGFGDAIAASVRAATQAIQEAEASVRQGELTEYFDGLRPLIVGAELAVVTLAGALTGRLIQALIATGVQAYASAAAMGAATVATRGFTAALALMGGPIGLAVTGLALLALNWEKVGGEATDAATMSEQAAARIAGALKKSADGAGKALTAQLQDVNQEIGLIDAELARTKFPLASPEDLADLRRGKETLLKIAGEIKTAMNGLGGGAGRGSIIPPLVSPQDAGGGTKTPAGKKEIGYAITDPRQEMTQRFLQSEKAAYEQIAEWERKQAEDAVRNAERMAEAQQRGRALAADVIAGDDPIARLMLDLERKRQALDEAAAIDQEQAQLYADAKVALEEQTAARIKAIQDKQRADQDAAQAAQLSAYGNLFGSMADLTKTFAGKQNAAYKVLFAASKAFAIAESIIKIQQGIANAAALPFPANLGAMASVVSATAGIISTIKGVNYGGGRQYGGPAAAGSLYRVNETGRPEMFTAANGAQFMLPTTGGRVTPADQVGGGSRVEVRVHNYAGADVQVTPSPDGRVVDIAVRRAKAEIASDIGNNTGDVWRALRGASNVQPRQG